jgi:phage baseplate assembly protein V
MTLADFKRLISPVTRRISSMIGRAVLKAIVNTEEIQTLTVSVLSNETIEGTERYQEYGFDSVPLAEAEALPIFVNGNRNLGLVICVRDKRYRPTDLLSGEVALYTSEDKTTPFRIQLKQNRTLFRRADIEDVDIDTSKTEDIGTSKAVTVPTETHTNSTLFEVKSSDINLGNGALQKLIDFRFQALFNAHVHSGVLAGGALTGVPTTTITASHMTAETEAS